MKTNRILLSLAAVLLLSTTTAHAAGARGGLGFNAPEVSGAPTGALTIAGGGTYDAAAGFVKMGGGFRCASDVAQGPLAGLHAGEGVRWEAVELLPTTNFKCSGSAGEAVKTATTDDDTVVLRVAFSKAGDGAAGSFTAKMFVSSRDLDPEEPGTQNIWIEGVGCGAALVNFR